MESITWTPLFGLLGLLGLACAGGEGQTGPGEEQPGELPEIRQVSHAQVVSALERSGNWELAARQIDTTRTFDPELVGDNVSYEERMQRAQEMADESPFIAADGERYEALYLAPDGKTYGRRGPAPTMPEPDAGTGYGAHEGAPSVAGDESIRRTSQPLGIGTDYDNDNRHQIDTGMTTYPTRTNGNMSYHATGNTKYGSCSGTKIGPRAVLTASHCVWDPSLGLLSAFWNPGQGFGTAPNGKHAWGVGGQGIYFRDHTAGIQYDYAVVFLPDTQQVYNLGHMGVKWWNGAGDYVAKRSDNQGYPCGPNVACGATSVQRCKGSPESNKICNGWMYSEVSDPLWFQDWWTFLQGQLEFHNDVSRGHSGSSVYTWINGVPCSLGISTHHAVGWSPSWGPRFRPSMWNDVCSWIADPNWQSSWGQHSLCHP